MKILKKYHEVKPYIKKVAEKVISSDVNRVAVIGINSYQNLEYQRALYQKKQADNHKDQK